MKISDQMLKDYWAKTFKISNKKLPFYLKWIQPTPKLMVSQKEQISGAINPKQI
jgi:hypothetical protein